jgi:transketolase
VAASERLRAQDIAVRCVSMPSWELFDAQPRSYRDDVLPPEVTARLAVELGVAAGLAPLRRPARRRAGRGRLRRVAPVELLLERHGFTVDNVVACGKRLCAR